MSEVNGKEILLDHCLWKNKDFAVEEQQIKQS